MSAGKFKELFQRFEGNPILTPKMWPYPIGAVSNPGAVIFNNETLLLARVVDRRDYSHFTCVRSKDGKTNWHIDSNPTLEADKNCGEAIYGLEDPRIVWMKERQEYVITYVSFRAQVTGEPPGISLATTKDFSDFKRLGQPMVPPNKDASLFPRTLEGSYVLMHRPIVDGRGDIWVSFSQDLKSWEDDRVLLSTRHRIWDNCRLGLGPPPIETPEGWLIIYHGSRETASGSIYRIGLALLDLTILKVIRRSEEWVFRPEKNYERVGDVDNIVFPCGAIVDEKTNELFIYYGAADSVIALATANLNDVLDYLRTCPES